MFCFSCTFFDSNDFNLNDLNKRISLFQVILDCIKGIFNKNQAKFLKELMARYFNEKLILLFNILFSKDFCFYMALVILAYKPNLFHEFIIRKIMTYSDIIIDFEYSELQKFPAEQLIDDLFSIFGNDNDDHKTSFIHLIIKDEHLSSCDFSNEEIEEAFVDYEKSTKKDKKKSIDNKEIEIKKSHDNYNINDKKISNDDLAKENEKELVIESEEKTLNNEIKNIVLAPHTKFNKVNDKKDNEGKDLNTIEEAKNRLEAIEKKLENLELYKKQNEEYKKQNEAYKKKFEEETKSQKKQIKKLKKENDSLKKIMNEMEKKMMDTNHKLEKIDSDLELIKFREGLKVFIDLLYSGVNLSGETYYENKMQAIFKELDQNYNSAIYDKPLIKKVKSALFKVYNKLKFGNGQAHDINLNTSILDQIFEKIKSPKDGNYYDDLIAKFRKTKAEKIMKELIINRKKYFKSPNQLEEIEKKIVSNNDFTEMLKRKKK